MPTSSQRPNDINPNQTATTTQRQWQLLSELQRKRWSGTKQIQSRLKTAGFDVSLRTIQRDLNQLAERFPIESNGETPQGWRWRDDAPQQALPQMSMSQAVVFSLVEQNLRQLLPPSFLQEMSPWFTMARSQLAGNYQTGKWLENIRILPATQPLIGPEIDSKAQDSIYEALLQRRRIEAVYLSRGSDSPDDAKRYILNPLALIQRGVVLYLICTKVDDSESQSADDIRMFALHRFISSKMLSQPSMPPEGFDLNQYVASGAFGFYHPTLKNRVANVSLTFTASAGKSLLESKLSEDQTVSIHDKTGNITITAELAMTYQLVWWLRGYGQDVLSIKPKVLADAVHER